MGGPRKLKNRIAIILDRSSSMSSIRKEAVQMFNDQVKTIKESGSKKMETKVSLFTFSDYVDDPSLFNQPIKELKPLLLENYIPAGNTALYDAMGQAIDRLTSLPEMADPNCSFLVLVVTDGEENASKKFAGPQLADRIQLLQKTGKWTFTFSGANIDVEKMQQSLHIPKQNATSWTASESGAHVHSRRMNIGTQNYLRSRVAGHKATHTFYAEPAAPTAPVTTTTTTTTTIPKPKSGTP